MRKSNYFFDEEKNNETRCGKFGEIFGHFWRIAYVMGKFLIKSLGKKLKTWAKFRLTIASHWMRMNWRKFPSMTCKLSLVYSSWWLN